MQTGDSLPVELHELSETSRLQLLMDPPPDYDRVGEYGDEDDEVASLDGAGHQRRESPFSMVEYWIFLLLGVAMLWAWNMFLAATPYFQSRFATNEWILTHFQSAEVSVATATNLVAMLVLSRLQKNASYPLRICSSLCISILCFLLLALSTLIESSAGGYFAFLMPIIFISNLATGLIQNGVFAYVAGFGRSEYMQGIMTGQAVAGVLPSVVQIISVVAVPSTDEKGQSSTFHESSKPAFYYFLAAVGVATGSLIAFLYLLRRQKTLPYLKSPSDTPKTNNSPSDIPENEPLVAPSQSSTPAVPPAPRKSISLLHLFSKLRLLSLSVSICFAATMLFPAFTSRIPSLSPSRLPPQIFIPLAFLIWNLGDLLGRLSTLLPQLSLTHHPFALFCVAMARLIFIPLYLLCNIGGRGATVPSDVFYLGVVQLGFGLSNGYVGSECMMGAGEWVAEEEREAAGAFMGLCLVFGLTVGSLLSFMVGEI